MSNNIASKVKQSSLSEFYKKVDHQALMPYYYQLAPISSSMKYRQQQTPMNQLYHSNSYLNSKSNISSQLVASYIPDSVSGVNSSQQPVGSLFQHLQQQQYQSIIGQQQQQHQSIYVAKDKQQNLFREYYEEGLVQNLKQYQQVHQIEIKTLQKMINQSYDNDGQGECSEVIEKLGFQGDNIESELRSKMRGQRQRCNDQNQSWLGCQSKKRGNQYQQREQEIVNQPVNQFGILYILNNNLSNQLQQLEQQHYKQQQQKLDDQTNKQPYSFSNSPQQQQPLQHDNFANNDSSQLLSSSSSEDQDQQQSQLLQQIRHLQSQVSQLKTYKYHYAINQYRESTRLQLQNKLQQSIGQIKQKYQLQQSALKKQYDVEISLYNKSIQDINKYKKTYAIILGQLRENKEKIENQYCQKIDQVNKFKQRLMLEWKRNSNQEIKKIINNIHPKYSIKLTNSIQRSTNTKQSKQKISPFIKQKSQELFGNQPK